MAKAEGLDIGDWLVNLEAGQQFRVEDFVKELQCGMNKKWYFCNKMCGYDGKFII